MSQCSEPISPQTHFSLLFAHKTICTHCATGMNSVKCHNFLYQFRNQIKMPILLIHTHTRAYTYTRHTTHTHRHIVPPLLSSCSDLATSILIILILILIIVIVVIVVNLICGQSTVAPLSLLTSFTIHLYMS